MLPGWMCASTIGASAADVSAGPAIGRMVSRSWRPRRRSAGVPGVALDRWGAGRGRPAPHRSSVKAIAKLMAAIVAARGASFDGTDSAIRTGEFGYRPSVVLGSVLALPTAERDPAEQQHPGHIRATTDIDRCPGALVDLDGGRAGRGRLALKVPGQDL